MLILRRHAPRDVQLPRPDVEVGACNRDCEVQDDALRGDGAGVGRFGDAPDGFCADEVGGLDQVVRVPLCAVGDELVCEEEKKSRVSYHVFRFFWKQGCEARSLLLVDLRL